MVLGSARRPRSTQLGRVFVGDPRNLLATKLHRLTNLGHKRHYTVSAIARDTNRLKGRVSLPKAAPELRLFRAPFPEARGKRKKARKQGSKEERR